MNDAILTTVPGTPGRFWDAHTTLVGPTRPGPRLLRLAGKKWAWRLVGIASALRLFRRRGGCRGVVTGGGAGGMLFAWLQTLLPRRRAPHVMVDCNWYLPQTRLGRWLKAAQVRTAARSVQQFVVWASHEVEDYSQAFGVPRERFRYVTFHSSLEKYTYEVRDDSYLFAGGNYDRDYRTLVEAVRPLDVPAWIATTRPELFCGIDLPPQVRVEGTTEAGFRQAMAAARLVVVPMRKGLLHSGGQQTLLNAMVMGKPVVAVGARWAGDFLRDRETGLIVNYEDVIGLRAAIAWVLEHPAEARTMARRGQAHARQFTTARCMEEIYRLAGGD